MNLKKFKPKMSFRPANTELLGGIDYENAWEAEYRRLGNMLGFWGVLLAVLFSPMPIFSEWNLPKTNEGLWWLMKLLPTLVLAPTLVLFRVFRFSHVVVFEITAAVMFISTNYRVDCNDWLAHTINNVLMSLTSAFVPILRPGYFVVNFCYAVSAYFFMLMYFCDMGFVDVVTERGFAMVMVVSIVAFSMAILRYYVMKNNFVQRMIIKAALGELEQKHHQIERANKELTQKNDEIQELNHELVAQNEEIIMQRDAIEEQKKHIEEINHDLVDSITYAKRIQEAILPGKDVFEWEGLECFVLFKPRDIVSGDFYWAGTHEGRLYIAACDCTGHGVPGAFMSMLGSTLLNDVLWGKGITEPPLMLAALDDAVSSTLKQQTGSGSQDGMDLSLCRIEINSRKAVFAAANNAVYFHRPGDEEIRALKPDKFGIGGKKDKDKIFTRHELDLSTPVTFYMFSDGYQDQIGGPKRRKFMVGAFKKLLAEIQPLSMAQQRDVLESTIDEWIDACPGVHQTDDILIVGVRVHPLS